MLPRLAPAQKAGLSGTDDAEEALLQKLMPRIQSIIEDAVEAAVSRAVADIRLAEMGSSMTGGTACLGVLEAGRTVAVDWTFTNTGVTPWPSGSRLRFVGGSLGPPQNYAPAPSSRATMPGEQLTATAKMTSPQDSGPCEAQWRLEGRDGIPLSPPLKATATVVAVEAPVAMQAASLGYTQAVTQPPQAPAPVPNLGGYPSQSVQPTYQFQSTATPGAAVAALASAGFEGGAWQLDVYRAAFEEFFGIEEAKRLQQDPGALEREVHRMINTVWEYMKVNGLQRPNESGVRLDAKLLRLFAPLLPKGTQMLVIQDLLPMTRQVAQRYLQAAAAGGGVGRI